MGTELFQCGNYSNNTTSHHTEFLTYLQSQHYKKLYSVMRPVFKVISLQVIHIKLQTFCFLCTCRKCVTYIVYHIRKIYFWYTTDIQKTLTVCTKSLHSLCKFVWLPVYVTWLFWVILIVIHNNYNFPYAYT